MDVMEQSIPYIVHGSFRKHFDEIQAAITALNQTGYAQAIAPHDCHAVGEQDGFVFLDGEQSQDPRQIEAHYLQKVLSLKVLGGFSLWVTPNGYMGKAAAYEYGVAQACGVPAFFTEMPQDVPFYVKPGSVKSVAHLAMQLRQGSQTIIRSVPDTSELGHTWANLLFPTASVAVGGIVRYRDKVLLVEDGRWLHHPFTVPGTTVRAQETRDEALQRALTEKFGVEVDNVKSLKTTFMLEGSGYGKPVSNLVFDDRRIDLSSERVHPQREIRAVWVSSNEAHGLVQAGVVEPNAAVLLEAYFS
jgi:hypothetical protein